MKLTADQWAEVQSKIRDLANTAYPQEACGFILIDPLEVVPVPNIADWPYAQFKISDADTMWAYKTGRCLAVWHSHPEDPAVPSPLDQELASADLYFVIYAVADEDMAVFRLEEGRLVQEIMVMPS